MANQPYLRTEIPQTLSRLKSLIKINGTFGGYVPDQNSVNGVPASLSNWALIGAVTSVTVDTNRGAAERRELNYDTMGKILEMVPGLVDYSIKFKRVMLYQSSLMEACGFAGHTLEYQTRPMLFSLELPSPDPAKIPTKHLLLVDCWLKANPIEFSVEGKDDLRIIQEVEIACGGVMEV